MAEAKAKKKGGKLPLIMVVVLVLAGGGFFMMSKGKGEKKKEPEIVLGGVESLGDEFVINLKDGSTFLVCQVSVQTEKEKHASDPSVGEGHGGGTYSVARDAVNTVLSQKTIDDLTKPEAMKFLKRELAAAMNHSLHSSHPPEEGKEEESDSKKDRKKKKDEHAEEAHAEIDHEYLDEIGMDAEEGPVLKVFFDKFMYQKT